MTAPHDALAEAEAALQAAEGVLFALPRSAQSKRRREVLAQVRAALAALRAGSGEDPPSRCPRCEGYEATYHTFEGECSLSRAGSGDSEPRPIWAEPLSGQERNLIARAIESGDGREITRWTNHVLKCYDALLAAPSPHDETLREVCEALRVALVEARKDVIAIHRAGFDSTRQQACNDALDRIEAALRANPPAAPSPHDETLWALVDAMVSRHEATGYCLLCFAGPPPHHNEDCPLDAALGGSGDSEPSKLREIIDFLDGYGDDNPSYVLSNVRRIANEGLAAGSPHDEPLRAALQMLWDNYLLPITDEQKQQVWNALALPAAVPFPHDDGGGTSPTEPAVTETLREAADGENA